jgi:hypothetical protein
MFLKCLQLYYFTDIQIVDENLSALASKLPVDCQLNYSIHLTLAYRAVGFH